VSLDAQIEDCEARIEARRAELILATEEAKDRVRSLVARPQTLILAVVLGFVVARLARPSPGYVPPAMAGKQSRMRRLTRGALHSGITRVLPLAMGPLQGYALQWLGRRFR
jgi:hypothetical protein